MNTLDQGERPRHAARGAPARSRLVSALLHATHGEPARWAADAGAAEQRRSAGEAAMVEGDALSVAHVARILREETAQETVTLMRLPLRPHQVKFMPRTAPSTAASKSASG